MKISRERFVNSRFFLNSNFIITIIILNLNFKKQGLSLAGQADTTQNHAKITIFYCERSRQLTFILC